MDRTLYEAATSGNVELLLSVFERDAQILLSKPPHGNTALHIAATLGHENFTWEILSRSRQLLAMKNLQASTPLHCAARAGRLEVVQILISNLRSSTTQEETNDWILRMKNKEGNTALHEALTNQHEDVAIMLLENDPELAFMTNNVRESPLHLAARDGQQKVVANMLEILPSKSKGKVSKARFSENRKRDLIVMKDRNGRTALHFAVWRDDDAMVDMILRMDTFVVPFSTDNQGFSPLHVAAAFGCEKAISKLLEHCPDAIEQLDRQGRNALHIAVLNGKKQSVSALLKIPNAGQKLNEQDQEGNTPLHLAAVDIADLDEDLESSVLHELASDTRADLSLMNKAGQTVGDLCKDRSYSLEELCERDAPSGKPRIMSDVTPKKEWQVPRLT